MIELNFKEPKYLTNQSACVIMSQIFKVSIRNGSKLINLTMFDFFDKK